MTNLYKIFKVKYDPANDSFVPWMVDFPCFEGKLFGVIEVIKKNLLNGVI